MSVTSSTRPGSTPRDVRGAPTAQVPRLLRFNARMVLQGSVTGLKPAQYMKQMQHMRRITAASPVPVSFAAEGRISVF